MHRNRRRGSLSDESNHLKSTFQKNGDSGRQIKNALGGKSLLRTADQTMTGRKKSSHTWIKQNILPRRIINKVRDLVRPV